MAKRHKLRKRHSRKLFSRTADRVHIKNSNDAGPYIMRGGIRL